MPVVASISVRELQAELAENPCILDVREPDEYAEGRVPGARLVPMASVRAALPDLPTDQPIYVICAVGGRSAYAAAFLVQQGFDAKNVEGGTQAWIASGYPVQA